jgi:hypothetical protein
MKYRMVKVDVANGERVWFEAQVRVLFFFWKSCFYSGETTIPATYRTWQDAADAIHRHKSLFGHVKRTVVRDW